jgi:hypothetical protein
VDVADRVAEAERREQELDRVGALVRTEEDRQFVANEAKHLGPHGRLAGIDEVLISPSLRAPERHVLDALNVKAATLGFCWTAPIVAMS